jgi:hypothetical protein
MLGGGGGAGECMKANQPQPHPEKSEKIVRGKKPRGNHIIQQTVKKENYWQLRCMRRGGRGSNI